MTSEEATIAVLDALIASHIPFIVVGSLSSNEYGIPRSTKDADFVVELGDKELTAVTRHLPPGIRFDRQLGFETVTMTRKYEASVAGNSFRIEFFLLSQDPHDRARFERRVKRAVHGREVWIPTPEDVIIQKVRWAFLGNRYKDRDDARGVIGVQQLSGTLDWDYIYQWCDGHGTRALLDEIRASVPLVP